MEDMIFNGQAHGTVAQRLSQHGMNVNALRPYYGDDGQPYITVNDEAIRTNAATLRKDEWKHYDTAIVEAARNRLNGVADLYSRGLVYRIPNGLGTTVLEYETMTDGGIASISMDGITRAKNDRPEFNLAYLPLPIIHRDFQINARVLAASRTRGGALDTTMAEQAARRVAEKIETILFQGASSYAYGGGTIYGYTDFPSRLTGSLSVHWDHSAASGATILRDVLAMKQALINVKRYGPYVLYIPTGYEKVMDDDFKAQLGLTIRARLLEIQGIEAVKVCDYLSADNVIMVQMQSDTVRMVEALPLSPVEWQAEGGMITHYKVMTIQVPQLRADVNGSCGICHYTL